jgi:hypothetical protein
VPAAASASAVSASSTSAVEAAATVGTAASHRVVTTTGDAASAHGVATATGETATSDTTATHVSTRGSEGISPTPLRSTKGAVVSGEGPIGAHPAPAVKCPSAVHNTTVQVASVQSARTASHPLTAIQIGHSLATAPGKIGRTTAPNSACSFPGCPHGASP